MRADEQNAAAPVTRGIEGGAYQPLSQADLDHLDGAAREILTTIGLSEAPSEAIGVICARGGRLTDSGRLLFPQGLIADALAGFQRDFVLHGRRGGPDLSFSGRHVHAGTGGAAPQIVDLETGRYRPSTLDDLFDAARLVNDLDHIHFFSRPMVAGGLTDGLPLDVNTAFACLKGTSKPVFTSCSTVESVRAVADMCFAVAGSADSFRAQPFLAVNINHVVCPLRFAPDAMAVMAEAARLGMPFHVNTFGQLGASTPVTIAGTLAQTTAETLAGMIFGWCVNPDARMTFGARPMLTDLRTGAMTGGSGEQAKLMACATQMAKHYDLPDTCIAGATDSKTGDVQSGYEKALAITLAAQAGSNAITQAAGSHASLFATALESYLIDNDMLGAILRSLAPVEVSDETVPLQTIRDVAEGEGHFLGEADTFARMHSDFLYPSLADRAGIEQWESEGGSNLRETARKKAQEMLDGPVASCLDPDVERHLRGRFDIRLTR